MGYHPVWPETHNELEGSPHLDVPNTAQPAMNPNGQPVESCAFPCYFDD